MVELTRKQRELERPSVKILQVSRPILITEGFQGLSMERVVSQMEYAKGTIYNHFPNKEEIVLALAVESIGAAFAFNNLQNEQKPVTSGLERETPGFRD